MVLLSVEPTVGDAGGASQVLKISPEGRRKQSFLPPEPGETANLMYKSVTDEQLSALARDLRFHRTLKTLDLRMNKFGDAGVAALVEAIIESHSCSLQVLRLAGNNITDVGAAKLSAMLMANSSVNFIGLNANCIGDAGAIQLLEALHHRPVHAVPGASIILTGNNIFDASTMEQIEATRRAPVSLVAGGGSNAISMSSRRSLMRRKDTLRSINPSAARLKAEAQPRSERRRSERSSGEGLEAFNAQRRRSERISGEGLDAFNAQRRRSSERYSSDSVGLESFNPQRRRSTREERNSGEGAEAFNPQRRRSTREERNSGEGAPAFETMQKQRSQSIMFQLPDVDVSKSAPAPRRRSTIQPTPVDTFLTGTDGDADQVDSKGIPLGDPEELPGGMYAPQLMEDVAGAMRACFIMDTEAKRFANAFVKEPCEQLLLAFAWHAVCTHVQTHVNEAHRERFYAMLVRRHTSLFASSHISADTKDVLAWYLPDALSRAATISLVKTYPQFGGVGASAAREKLVNPAAESLRKELFEEIVSWMSGFGSSTGRKDAVSVMASKGGRTGDPEKARRSMPVAVLPPVRRQMRDVSACSPLVSKWLQLRQEGGGGVRGGSSSAREHRVRCSLPCQLPARPIPGAHSERDEGSAPPTPRALTYRDVRKEARRLSTRLATDFTRVARDVEAQVSVGKMHMKTQMSAMKSEELNIKNDNAIAHEYANYLVAASLVEEQYEESQRALEH